MEKRKFDFIAMFRDLGFDLTGHNSSGQVEVKCSKCELSVKGVVPVHEADCPNKKDNQKEK